MESVSEEELKEIEKDAEDEDPWEDEDDDSEEPLDE